MVPCLLEALGSEDWATRKGAAEALKKLASVERDLLAEFKGGCLKVFEDRRFDKVFRRFYWFASFVLCLFMVKFGKEVLNRSC